MYFGNTVTRSMMIFCVMCMLACFAQAQSNTHIFIKLDGATTPGNIKINDNGKVAMTINATGNVKHAARWDCGTLLDLGVAQGFTNSFANNINNQDQVVGYLASSNSSTLGRMFKTDQLNNISTISSMWTGQPGAINEASTIAGNLASICGAFYYSTYINQYYAVSIGDSHAYDINNSNHILMDWREYSGTIHNCIYNIASSALLTTMTTPNAHVTAFNDFDQVTGDNPSGSYQRAFRYDNGATTNLAGTTGYNYTYGKEINDIGEVVGYQTATNGSAKDAVYWGTNNQPIRLYDAVSNEPFMYTFNTAESINNYNDIVGFGTWYGTVSGYVALRRDRYPDYLDIPRYGVESVGGDIAAIKNIDSVYAYHGSFPYGTDSYATMTSNFYAIPSNSTSTNGVNSYTTNARVWVDIQPLTYKDINDDVHYYPYTVTVNLKIQGKLDTDTITTSQIISDSNATTLQVNIPSNAYKNINNGVISTFLQAVAPSVYVDSLGFERPDGYPNCTRIYAPYTLYVDQIHTYLNN